MKRIIYSLIALSALMMASCMSQEQKDARAKAEVMEIADRYMHSYLKCQPDSIVDICTDSLYNNLRRLMCPTSKRDSALLAQVKILLNKTTHTIQGAEIKGDSAEVTYAMILKGDTLSPTTLQFVKTDGKWKVDVLPYYKRKNMKMPKFQVRKQNKTVSASERIIKSK